ncbi:Metallo-dependent phosphatase-like protein [Coniella lustricola]|uniref:Metallo-dependent phosphatase-like protein n=1 Tax=Coniella lustricola TaxID=2025994 RepID=A0A2T2ZZE9_9PEZI|nr:Metallo-dependent phosphatase-like protein [Coniella lustricola]
MAPTAPVPLSFTASPTNLTLTPSQTFHLTIFQDLHFGEAEDTTWGPLQDIDTLSVIETVLNSENETQLVVLNGDLITGEDTFRENATAYVDEIVAPLVRRGLSWAATYGNHDSDYNLSRTAIYNREKTYSNSLTGNMVQTNDSGVSNYYLPVYTDGTNTDANAVPALLLWFFDSRGGYVFHSSPRSCCIYSASECETSCAKGLSFSFHEKSSNLAKTLLASNYYQQLTTDGTPIGQPNWVSSDVVNWFNSTRTTLAALYSPSPLPPSLAFVHIPIDAFLSIQESSSGIDAHTEPGINADIPLSQQGVQSDEGSSQTSFTYEGQDVPFMQALLGTENLLAVFSGHDHGNDWCARWDGKVSGLELELVGDGIDLCFSRHTGYGGYGSWTRGSRQVKVSLAGEGGVAVETWMRLEDGSVTGRVTLNATFGTDEYPEVPLTYTSEYDEGDPYTK